MVEKILGVVKDSYHDNPVGELSRRIRHPYDICLIIREEKHKVFLKSGEFSMMCENCIADERVLFEDTAALFDLALIDAPLFSNFEQWRPPLETVYNNDFKGLVYRDLPHMDEIAETLKIIRSAL